MISLVGVLFALFESVLLGEALSHWKPLGHCSLLPETADEQIMSWQRPRFESADSAEISEIPVSAPVLMAISHFDMKHSHLLRLVSGDVAVT